MKVRTELCKKVADRDWSHELAEAKKEFKQEGHPNCHELHVFQFAASLGAACMFDTLYPRLRELEDIMAKLAPLLETGLTEAAALGADCDSILKARNLVAVYTSRRWLHFWEGMDEMIAHVFEVSPKSLRSDDGLDAVNTLATLLQMAKNGGRRMPAYISLYVLNGQEPNVREVFALCENPERLGQMVKQVPVGSLAGGISHYVRQYHVWVRAAHKELSTTMQALARNYSDPGEKGLMEQANKQLNLFLGWPETERHFEVV